MVYWKSKCIALVLGVLFLIPLLSQDLIKNTRIGITSSNDGQIVNRIAENIISNSSFQKSTPVQLFDFPSQKDFNQYYDEIEDGLLISLNAQKKKKLLTERPSNLVLKIPVNPYYSVELQLYEVDILGPDYHLETSSKGIVKLKNGADRIFYHGIVKGNTNSIAALSIVGDWVQLMLSDENGNYVIAPVDDNSHIFYNDADMKESLGEFCGVIESRHNLSDRQHNFNDPDLNKSMLDPCVGYFVECDYQTYQDHGSNVGNVEAFVTALVNESAIIYSNESIDIFLESVLVWDSPDPYIVYSDMGDILEKFGETRQDDYDGRLAHLISTRNLGGGIAWVDVLCSTYFTFQADWDGNGIPETHHAGPYAASASLSTSVSGFPAYSWNVEVFTHEAGHNFGSPHTQSCSWPGGAIDNCYFTEGGCGLGPDPGGAEGTIMSYCHLCAGSCGGGCASGVPDCPNPGINFNNGFGPLPGDLIRDRYNNPSCTLECDTGGEIFGCMDPGACNYNPDATSDDGSCEYLSCAGCTDVSACNYDPDATIDDGSCEYVSCLGCMDPGACNYDPDATIDDGSCEYMTCAGCTDMAACNYDPDATIDDGSCEYTSCLGCTDPLACNYDPDATIDDGSCNYLICVGCTDPLACNYDPDANLDDGSCEYLSCVGCDGANIELSGDVDEDVSASHTIVTEENVETEIIGDLSFTAGQSITFYEGFIVDAGNGIFVSIDDCSETATTQETNVMKDKKKKDK